jgi:uncharacterized membrane protein YadS
MLYVYELAEPLADTTLMSPATGSGSTNCGISAPGNSVCGVTPWAPALPTTTRRKTIAVIMTVNFLFILFLLPFEYCSLFSFFERRSQEMSLGVFSGFTPPLEIVLPINMPSTFILSSWQ